MAIGSVNYSQPVIVNGYPCRNCTDVDLAKAHVDPQHPKAGPYGVNAQADPSLAGKDFNGATGAVSFAGALGDTNNSGAPSASPASSRGRQINLAV